MNEHDEQYDAESSEGARRLLVITLLASLVVGAAWGLHLYGSLEDVRAWNATGLVLITFVFLVGLIVGARAWLSDRGTR